MDASTIRLNPVTLRGLAHPLRMRMLGALRLTGPATATMLAERFGESTGSTSYHLRQLAAHGFVEEDASRGTGRERWWHASTTTTQWSSTELEAADPEAAALLGGLNRLILATQTEQLERWFSTQNTWSQDWRDASTNDDWYFRLTPAQLADLRDELHAVLRRRQQASPPLDRSAKAGTELVAILLHAFPRREDRP